MKTMLLLLMLVASCAADPMHDLREQDQHDEIVAQMKEANRIAREQLENADNVGKEPDIILLNAQEPCTYALIKKGGGYETYTFTNGQTVDVYVRVCHGEIQ